MLRILYALQFINIWDNMIFLFLLSIVEAYGLIGIQVQQIWKLCEFAESAAYAALNFIAGQWRQICANNVVWDMLLMFCVVWCMVS